MTNPCLTLFLALVLGRYNVFLVYRHVDVGRQVLVKLLKKFLKHIIPVRPLHSFQNLGYMNQVAHEFGGGKEHMMLCHIIRERPNDLLVMPRH
jgi:hypothetical protein